MAEKDIDLRENLEPLIVFGPGHVDQQVRRAIEECWMALPDQRKSLDEVERQMRRLLDRAIRDFKEDAAAFRMKLPGSRKSSRSS
jgi:hypothetical protein